MRNGFLQWVVLNKIPRPAVNSGHRIWHRIPCVMIREAARLSLVSKGAMTGSLRNMAVKRIRMSAMGEGFRDSAGIAGIAFRRPVNCTHALSQLPGGRSELAWHVSVLSYKNETGLRHISWAFPTRQSRHFHSTRASRYDRLQNLEEAANRQRDNPNIQAAFLEV
jgi:hypothetical protein